MGTALDLAKTTLLDPAGLTSLELENILSGMLGHSLDYADLYFQAVHHEYWSLEDGIVKDSGFDIDRGVGVRAISGDKTGFAYSDDIMKPALLQAVGAAKGIAKQGQKKALQAWQSKQLTSLYIPENPLLSLKENDKVSLLTKIDKLARSIDNSVTHVMASLAGTYEVILVVASDGTFMQDVRPLVRLNVQVIAEKNGRREQGLSGGGARNSYQYFFENDLYKDYTKEAVRLALVNLEAIDAPAGAMPVILGSGWPGILLHEAIGHGLEGDFNRKGSSAFSGRIGEKIASDLCTVVDDGTLVGRRGSLTIDDEGTPSQCTTLIENGKLITYMQDKHNARLMGTKSTGNGRRESYAHIPLPRMTNTYMLNGNHDPQEIIKSVNKGLYAVNFGGGQVDITSGKFVFSASEAYLIENGKITAPVKGATLIGNGPDVLTRVTMVGNDLKLDQGVGVCGKEGQSVPVGVGQPTLKIKELTVGGTA